MDKKSVRQRQRSTGKGYKGDDRPTLNPPDDQVPVDPEEYARLLEVYDSGFSRIAEGDVIHTTVRTVTQTKVVVELGLKSAGTITVDDQLTSHSVTELTASPIGFEEGAPLMARIESALGDRRWLVDGVVTSPIRIQGTLASILPSDTSVPLLSVPLTPYLLTEEPDLSTLGFLAVFKSGAMSGIEVTVDVSSDGPVLLFTDPLSLLDPTPQALEQDETMYQADVTVVGLSFPPYGQ